MKTKVINFIGKPCAGKSIKAAELYVKMKNEKYNVELEREYIKELIIKNKKINQYKVAKKQYQKLKEYDHKIDYLIFDSSLINNLVYNKKKNHKIIEKWLNEFDNIFIFIVNQSEDYDCRNRIHNMEESIKKEKELFEICKQLGVTCKLVEVNSTLELDDIGIVSSK